MKMKVHLRPSLLSLMLIAATTAFFGCSSEPAPSETREAAAPTGRPVPSQPAAESVDVNQRRIAALEDRLARGQINEAEYLRGIARIKGIDESLVADNQPTRSQSTASAAAPTPVPAAVPAASVAEAGNPIEDQLAGLRPYTSQVVLRNQLLRSKGSDTMDILMARWEEDFKAHHSNIRVLHEGEGSSTAVTALIEGSADFGPMSRAIKASELEDFTDTYGHPPTQIPVAIDALAVYVHPNNPVARSGLTLAQVDAIFSADRKRGFPREVRTWGDLGLTGDYANRPIVVYSRDTKSGTYGFFQKTVLLGGDYKSSNTNLPSSEALVSAIEIDPYAVGYSGIGYITPGVAATPLAMEDGGAYIAATGQNAIDGSYPLARNLFLTINHDPKGDRASPLHSEFLNFVFSPEGQRIVLETGYFPVNRAIADSQLARLGF